MKKVLLLSAMFIIALTGCANEGKVHVKGNLKNVGDTLMVVTPENLNDGQTVPVKDGQFEFDYAIDKVKTIYIISPDLFRKEEGGKAVQIQLVAVPGETAELVGDVTTRYDIGGSQFYKEYHEVNLLMEGIEKETLDLQNRCVKMLNDGVDRDSVAEIFSSALIPLREKIQKNMIGYVKDHPNQEASAVLVAEIGVFGLDKMKEAEALLGDKVKNGRMKAFYQSAMNEVKAQEKAEAKSSKQPADGTEAPDFTLNDIYGKPLSLSSLRGKYVIIDFWGSWCTWCIKGFPEMKNYYNKYKGKFEILGVDCNDTEQKWKDAVKKYELPWLHVYNPRDSKVLEEYGIEGFPTKIIVGPDGKIVKTIIGEDPAFYTLLDKLFQ